jgi:drug/metabolite transporter (DMT)-like permease
MNARAPVELTMTGSSAAAAEDRRMRFLAIALMCGAMLCFTGLDTSSKWLGVRLPTAEIVWSRYVGAALIALVVARPWARPAVLRSKRPGLQALRSLLLLGSTASVVVALRWLQLAETATISFLTPIFVALFAGPMLGEQVGRERMIAIVVGFLGVLIATRPGTGAFQPVVLIAIAGVACNSGYVLATRKLAGVDSAPTTLVWTQAAGLLVVTPMLPWIWRWPESIHVWLVMAGLGVFGAAGHGLLIVAHKFAPAPVLTPFTYTQLIWMVVSGLLVFGDWPPAATIIGAALVTACGAYLALRERANRGPRLVPAAGEDHFP